MSKDKHRFGQWQFAPDFSRARAILGDGEVTFTRAERAILGALSQRPGLIVSRDQLLDRISGEGSDTGQRSVDFLINRLRRKLGDPARNPNFIATQYGEGYVWIAREPVTAAPVDEAHIVIGPIQGLAPSGEEAERGWDFVNRLADEIGKSLQGDRKVRIIASRDEMRDFDLSKPRIGIGVKFLFARPGQTDVVLSVSRIDTHATVLTRRLALTGQEICPKTGAAFMADLATTLIDQVWSVQTHPSQSGAPDEDAPLAVRMHEAEMMLAEAEGGMLEGEKRLRAAIEANPKDCANYVLLATAIHSNMVVGGFTGLRSPSDFVRGANEIEDQLLKAIEHIDGNDILSLAAAKLLWFTDPKWRQLAMDMAEDVFSRSTSFITAFSTVGQLRMWDGRGEEALALFERAQEFVTVKTSQVGLYLAVQQAMAHLSMGDQAAAAAEIAKVLEHDVRGLPRYALMFDLGPEFDREAVLKATCATMTAADARAFLYYMHFMFARHFVDPLARRNFMKEPAAVVRRFFGEAALPFEARADLGED
jgi:DNA-binding winged helix-turn-helix (wHTH) protein